MVKRSILPSARKFTKKEYLFMGLAIVAIGGFTVLIPYLVGATKLKGFTMNTFNFVGMVLFNILLYFINIKLGLLASILLMSLMIYAKLEGATFAPARFYGQRKENMTAEQLADTNLDEQYKLPSDGVEMHNKMKPSTGNEKKVELPNDAPTLNELGVNDAIKPDFTPEELKQSTNVEMVATTTTAPEAKEEGFVDTPMEGENVAAYMDQLNQDALTTPLKTTDHEFDVIGCRYDMAESAQNTATYGPPMAWNATYKDSNINGQLFYPLHA